MLCERPSGGGVALDFEDVTNRVTSYHAMQIRGKFFFIDGTGSHRRALNAVVHGGARGFHRQSGRGQGRGRRGNGGGTANVNNNSSNSNNSNGVFNSNGNSNGRSSASNARYVRGIGRGSQTSGRRDRGRGQDNGQNHQVQCRYRHDSPEHGWHNCPLRLSHEAEDQMPINRSMPCRNLLRIHGAHRSSKTTTNWRTSRLLSETTHRGRICLLQRSLRNALLVMCR